MRVIWLTEKSQAETLPSVYLDGENMFHIHRTCGKSLIDKCFV
jgi:hypothetical protein